MKIFLSWSGEQSRLAAEAFREWLPYMINAAEPWMSATDIDAGARWSAEIQQNLEETRIGVLFVTQANVSEPWLLFEAGALAKTLTDTFVCPYLFRMKPTDLPSGPLTQFQAKTADKSGTWQLVQTINRALKDDAIPEGRLEKSFDMWWPDLEAKLKNIASEVAPAPATRKPDEMIEEILTIVRRLDRSTSSAPSLESWNFTDSYKGNLWQQYLAVRDILAHSEVKPDKLSQLTESPIASLLKEALKREFEKPTDDKVQPDSDANAEKGAP